ncbi:MAG: VanZ family protein [Acidobacteriota bacterium]
MSRRAAIVFVLYVCAVTYLSLFPGEFLLHARADRLYWMSLNNRRQIMDAILNVFFYVPVGVSGFWALQGRGTTCQRKALAWLLASLSGILLSACIEWLQLWSPVRYGSLTDLASNGLGAILGATIGAAIGSAHLSTFSLHWRLRATQVIFLGVWFLWQTFPFVPILSSSRLGQLNHLAPWSWRTCVEVFLAWVVLTLVLQGSQWLWIAYAALLAQMFLLDRSLSVASMAGAAAGFLVAWQIGAKLLPILSWTLPAWMAFEELRPFTPRDPVPFIWAPFLTWFDAGSDQFYTVLFGKLFLYTATVWCLRKQRMTWWQAIGIPALILAVGEAAQCWIEGRTPESTDVILEIAGAVLLLLAEKKVRSRATLVPGAAREV